MTFIQSTHFSREWDDYGLIDEDLHALEVDIMSDPKQAPVIAGSGGLRKLRFAPKRLHKGKRGAFRIGYVYFEAVQAIFLLVIYKKNEKDTMSSREKQECKQLIGEIEKMLTRRSLR
jgi:hypothetical protein